MEKFRENPGLENYVRKKICLYKSGNGTATRRLQDVTGTNDSVVHLEKSHCLPRSEITNKQTKQSFSVFCGGYINKIFGLGIFKVPTIVTVEHST